MADEQAPPAKQSSAAARARQARREMQKANQRTWFRYMLYCVYALLAIVIAFGAIDRFRAWDVSDHTTEYFGQDDFVGQHPNEPVLYEQVPPVGGPHAGVPQACGFYSEYIRNENAVHSMEHGAVWVTYQPDLPADQIEDLKQLAAQPYVLVSPYPGIPAPIVVSAWGHQMTLGSFDEDKINAFREKYGNNREYSPEFGASCGTRHLEVTTDVPQQEPYIQGVQGAPAIGGIPLSEANAAAGVTSEEPAATPSGTPVASPVASPIASPMPAR
jgi:hypothetical protein